jgi:glycosyltransferase involved in cell wall biosynthesis
MIYRQNKSKDRRINILIHTQYYPPEIGAPQSRLSELAQGLNKKGFQVSILTAMPSYPTGKLFPGYSGLFFNEEIDGITIYRSYTYPTQSVKFIKRLLNYFSFVFSSLIRGVFLKDIDIIFTESPPLFLGVAGYLLSKLKKAKWIFNVADLWPESIAELGLVDKKSYIYKFSQYIEGFFYRNAVLVTGQTKTILKYINYRYPKVATYHLSNGVIPENYRGTKQSYSKNILIMYAGLHGIAQGLDLILETAKQLLSFTEIEFQLIGEGPTKSGLINQAQNENITNVKFMDPVPKNKIPELLANADILIVPLKTQLTGAVPSKLYEAMAAGKPVILIAEGEAAEIVTDAKCGVLVVPGDNDGLKNAIIQLSKNPQDRKFMGENGRNYVIQNYNRNVIVENFIDRLITLTS